MASLLCTFFSLLWGFFLFCLVIQFRCFLQLIFKTNYASTMFKPKDKMTLTTMALT